MSSDLDRKAVIETGNVLVEKLREIMQGYRSFSELARLTAVYQVFMDQLGISPDANSRETAYRVSKMMRFERCPALHESPPELTVFPREAAGGYDEYIAVKDIPFWSVCSHHHVTFFGQAHIVYHPDEHVVGLSKFARVVQHFAAKPQIQEGLTEEIAEYLYEKLQPKGLLVNISAEHLCMQSRGARAVGSGMVTQKILGYLDKIEASKMLK